MKPSIWAVNITGPARRDFAKILGDTRRMFGEEQQEVYRALLIRAFGKLTGGPDVPGSAKRNELSPGLRTLHLNRVGGCGSHQLLYRATSETSIDVLRILHERMDIARHLPKS